MAKRKKQAKSDYAKGHGRKPSVFPAHLRVKSVDEWRDLKRTEWRAVEQALARYVYGSAYAPAGEALYQIGKLAEQVREALDDNFICW